MTGPEADEPSGTRGFDRPARPVRAPRAPAPDSLGPARALAGAAVAVAGVALGIGTLLWVSDEPSPDGPAVQAAADGPVVSSPTAAPSAEPEPSAEPSVGPSAEPSVGPSVAPTGQPPAAPPVATEPAPAPPPSASPPAPRPPAPPASARAAVLPVTVLNNSRVDGLAARAAERFEAGGWPVRDTGSLRGRIRATTVYYDRGQEAAARAFAAQFRGIERVLPRIEGLPGSGLTVVVTRDFRA